MTTSASFEHPARRVPPTWALRNARCYAPAAVTRLLDEPAGASELVLIMDVDALERSALAKVDRVMLLALDSLATSGVHIVLRARRERERAALLCRSISHAWCVAADAAVAIAHVQARLPSAQLIAFSDDPDLFGALAGTDRGLALGRPELASSCICAIGDTAVRATLWWLLEQRNRATAA